MRLGQHHSEETKAKMSIANSNPSPEARAKMSVAHMGRIKSPETCAKLSAAAMGRVLSPEIRAKISAAQWRGGSSVWRRKQKAKRRTLGFNPLNSPFPGSEGHHVDNEQVIHMAHALHRSVYHNQHTGQCMAAINAIAYNFLFKQEVEAILETT